MKLLTNPLCRRADTVRAALVRDGVPDNVIAEAWRGKENPAVPTPDGVRDRRNRRVEIVESHSRPWFGSSLEAPGCCTGASRPQEMLCHPNAYLRDLSFPGTLP